MQMSSCRSMQCEDLLIILNMSTAQIGTNITSGLDLACSSMTMGVFACQCSGTSARTPPHGHVSTTTCIMVCGQVYLAAPTNCPQGPNGEKRKLSAADAVSNTVGMYVSDNNGQNFKEVCSWQGVERLSVQGRLGGCDFAGQCLAHDRNRE